MILRNFYIFFFCVFSSVVFSQQEALIKELKGRLKSEQHDTLMIKDMITLSDLLFTKNYQESIEFNNQAIDLANNIKRFDLQIKAMNVLADGFWYSARYDMAFDYYYKAYKLADSVKDKIQIANSLYNIGWLSCIDQKNFNNVNYLFQSLKLSNEVKEVDLVLKVYNALGFLYVTKYQEQKVKIDFDSAVYYLQLGKELARKLKKFPNMKSFNVNLGDLFFSYKDYASSKFYYQNGLENAKVANTNLSLDLLEFKITSCNYALDPSGQNLSIIKAGFDKLKQSNEKDDMLEALNVLANLLYDGKQFEDAIYYYDEYLKVKLELDKLTYANNLISKENTSNLEKANARKLALQQANEIEELNNKRKTTYLIILVVISCVIALIVYLLFNQNKLKQTSNQKLEQQNRIISEKKEEIEQSIVYAKGIQTSFLPDKNLLDIFLPNNFIFYQPKDIVSGDFYWFETSKNKQQILIACADSTGHGVPGALMSMVGINFLQLFGGTEKLNSPSTILQYLNNGVKNALKQNSSDNKQRDGMDIGLVLIDFTNNKLLFSGANRPLYIIRNKELIEIKATKQAIGGFTEYDQTFRENEFQLKPNDMLVLSTDGYADQFGGADGKKLMTKNLKNYLIQISGLSGEEQLMRLKTSFNEWKGNYDQVDDVCVIGINIT